MGARVGKRVNMERVDEALELNPELISTACPFCTTMVSDGVAQKVQAGELDEGQVEVLDISEVLQRGRMLPMVSKGVAENMPVAAGGSDDAGKPTDG